VRGTMSTLSRRLVMAAATVGMGMRQRMHQGGVGQRWSRRMEHSACQGWWRQRRRLQQRVHKAHIMNTVGAHCLGLVHQGGTRQRWRWHVRHVEVNGGGEVRVVPDERDSPNEHQGCSLGRSRASGGTGKVALAGETRKAALAGGQGRCGQCQ
jgi:hypothetical protein